MVLKEISSSADVSASSIPASVPTEKGSGPSVLVVAGPHSVQAPMWGPLFDCPALSPTALLWSGGQKRQLPDGCAHWSVREATSNSVSLVSDFQAVVLLGPDLSVLGSLANFAGDGVAPAGVALAALASGKPVFLDDNVFESFRRHSSRLSSGLVRRFEELYRIVQSFGVETGSAEQLSTFLRGLNSQGESVATAPRSAGRDVVTVEDVEAVRRSGGNRMQIALGSIVTPLASQKASEWGIEVSFQ